MTLLIKGNRFQAAKAAADRGIALAFVNEFGGITVGRANISITMANAWLCEDPSLAPYPIGSLLSWHTANSWSHPSDTFERACSCWYGIPCQSTCKLCGERTGKGVLPNSSCSANHTV